MENTANSALYNLLITHDFDPETKDVAGNDVDDPTEAELFSFDWVGPSGKNYGTVVILLTPSRELTLFSGDNIGRTMEPEDKTAWYGTGRKNPGFLGQLKSFAVRSNLGKFDIQDISRLKYTMQGMAAIKEGLFEGYYGKKNISYSDQPKQVRLMIKHNRNIEEGEARYRAIEGLFVETADGERFKVPSRSLAHGRMLARHVAEGGNPYDAFGQHINNVVVELATLGRFIRAAKHKKLNGPAAEMAEDAVRHYSDLKAKAKHMISQRGYHEARETFDPAEITETDVAVENIRNMFIEQTIDNRIEEALPILAKLQGPKMREAEEFENWTDRVMEGTWALPDTPESDAKLKELMAKPLIVGADATNATEQLYDLIGDDILFDRLNDLADQDPNANCWENPEVINRLGELGIDINPTVNSMAQDAEQNDAEEVNEDENHNPVAGAITRRILSQRLDLVKKYGPLAITQAIDDVADFVGDVEEIGSSDVSGWVRQVEQSLGGVDEGFGDTVKKVGGAIAHGASKAFDKLGGGTNQELLDKLRKDAGLPSSMAVPNKDKEEQDMAEAGYGSTNPDLMSPGDYDRYQQDQMDGSKRDFKRQEHDAEWEQEKAHSQKLATQAAGPWYVRINGKIVKDQQGNAFTFDSKDKANKAAITMRAKPFNKNKVFMLSVNPNDKSDAPTEDLDTDGVMMTQPSNMSSESVNRDLAKLKQLIEHITTK